MKPKDLIEHMETGDRTKEWLAGGPKREVQTQAEPQSFYENPNSYVQHIAAEQIAMHDRQLRERIREMEARQQQWSQLQTFHTRSTQLGDIYYGSGGLSGAARQSSVPQAQSHTLTTGTEADFRILRGGR